LVEEWETDKQNEKRPYRQWQPGSSSKILALCSLMFRKSFVMQLNHGAEEEYRRRHNPIWEELAQVLHSHGVRNYSIFLHPETNQLFAYAEIEDEARWNAIAGTPVCRRWWNFMADLMEVNPDNSPRVIEQREVFHLD
jgi:L-rhamnose mutarotase